MALPTGSLMRAVFSGTHLPYAYMYVYIYICMQCRYIHLCIDICIYVAMQLWVVLPSIPVCASSSQAFCLEGFRLGGLTLSLPSLFLESCINGFASFSLLECPFFPRIEACTNMTAWNGVFIKPPVLWFLLLSVGTSDFVYYRRCADPEF